MSKYLLSKELVDATVDYLARQPYIEVTKLLNGFTQEVAPQLSQNKQPVPPENKNEQSAEVVKLA